LVGWVALAASTGSEKITLRIVGSPRLPTEAIVGRVVSATTINRAIALFVLP